MSRTWNPQHRSVMWGCLLVLFVVITWGEAPTAHAGDIRVTAGLGGAGTEWRSDAMFTTKLKFGYRFLDVFGIYGDFGLGYAGVDQRVLTQFALGIQGWLKFGIVRPYLRVSIVHQHEESLSVVAGNFGKAILGIGEGIRHRGGIGFGLGTDIPIFRYKKLRLFLAIEAFLKWFPGDMGPAVYAGGNLSLGMNFHL